MACCSIRNVDANVLFPAGVNLSKSPGDVGDSPLFLSSRDSVAYCPMLQANGANLTNIGENSLKKKPLDPINLF